eukprot:TRINITY_DN2_c0_g1::TRINITY_DN2_c0_g1_i1::g.14911::m.14911 TRINITY_DN2_c0_g1::TRINITY_DN2_c0_g1_i1::g.14911  ORF type:complete len:437 (+),score=117.27,sp/Q9V3Z6/MYO7A_DROME/24.93/8e-20,FERM_M/PF00373.13/3.6e-09,RA/PF00788.18/3.9e-07,zf-B_box/PF00643.19/6.4e-06,zf-C2H2_jaz/PF12171.3/5.8e+03,zf-C2H2_jaz/PF12171.3/0.0051,IRS/PF02174.12/0.12,zf-C3HC4_2/PF13923.1/0.17,zf-C3HC4_3/PF13920.1/0.17,zf-RING_5/PF14634.1/7.6e+03,zf-RING_5/PF14634.1/1.1 TRINITY_DN2_c0_g1_i1:70-1380(+)
MGTIMKIYYVDGSSKSLSVAPSWTARKAADVMAEKLDLKIHPETYYIFELRNEKFERCLNDTEKLVELEEQFKEEVKQKEEERKKKRDKRAPEEEKATPTLKFVFKKRLFGEKEDVYADVTAFRLQYMQAVAENIKGNYPIEDRDYKKGDAARYANVLKAAALQFHVSFGKPGDTHKPGFLGDAVAGFISSLIYDEKTPTEWEEAIYERHKMGDISGLTPDEAKRAYLDICMKFPFYGSSLFYCKQKQFKQLSENIFMAVNHAGIHMLDFVTKECFKSYKFSEIYSWAASQTKFAFVVGNVHMQQKFNFETRQGQQITDLIQAYVKWMMIVKNANAAQGGSAGSGEGHSLPPVEHLHEHDDHDTHHADDSQQHQPPAQPAGNVDPDHPLCDNCEEEPSSVWCVDCQEFYCEECNKTLHKAKAKKDHQREVVDLSAL